MKSYIKIYGPPISKAIKALEKISIDMPNVCIMSADFFMRTREATQEITRKLITTPLQSYALIAELAIEHFGASGISLPEERCRSIISRSGESLGEYDFFYEWLKDPTQPDLYNLIEKIDEALTPLGCNYTITTKPR